MADIVAVLDANVLFNGPVRDTILRAAEKDLLEVYWTTMILEETRRNLIAKHIMDEAQIQRLFGQLRSTFKNALVAENYQQHIPQMRNHPKDRHVLAAAVEVGADDIITFNIRDFQKSALAPYEIKAVTPDEVLNELLIKAPDTMRRILLEQAQQLNKPPVTLAELLSNLEKHIPKFCQRVRPMLRGELDQ